MSRKNAVLLADDLSNKNSDTQKRSQVLQKFATDLAGLFGCKTDLAYIYNTPQWVSRNLTLEDAKRIETLEFEKQTKEMKNISAFDRLIVKLGWPIDLLLRLSKDQRYSAMVLGTKAAHGMDRFFLGSVAEEVARSVKIPLYILGPAVTSTNYQLDSKNLQLVVATDLTKHSRAAEAYAVGLAKKLGAKVHFYYSLKEVAESAQKFAYLGGDALPVFDNVLEDLKKDAMASMQKKLDRLKAQGVNCDAHIDSSDVELIDGVLKLASTPNSLIVMGHQGRGFIAQAFLGSNMRKIISQAKVPVAVVRS